MFGYMDLQLCGVMIYFIIPGCFPACNITVDDVKGVTVDCSHLRLQHVPQNIPRNTSTLILKFNNIPQIKNGDFQHLFNLQLLDLSFNPIVNIQNESFNGLNNLQDLVLYGHSLNYTDDSLPTETFKPLGKLQTLHLRSNLSHITHEGLNSTQAFGYLRSLVTLDIDTTYNTIFPPVFSHLTNLQVLKIGEFTTDGITINCGLKILTRKTFAVFSMAPIHTLDISSCSFHQYDEDSLAPFPNLKSFIYPSGCLLNGNLSTIFNSLAFYKHKNMSDIIITYFELETTEAYNVYPLPMEVLPELCVSNLDLTHSRIGSVDFDRLLFTFPLPIFTKCIKHWTMSKNSIHIHSHKITSYFIFEFSNMETFDWSMQFVFSKFPEQSTIPHKTKTDIGIPLFLPPKLKEFNVAGTFIEVGSLMDVYFFHGENVLYLNVSYCGFFHFNYTFIGIENLQVLDFSGNILDIDNDRIFATLPNLVTLRLSDVFLDNQFIIEHGRQLFSTLTKLENLDLSQNGLTVLPYDMFNSMRNLRIINLNFNNLINIPDVVNLMNLKYLYLSYNSLTSLNRTYRNMLDETALSNPNLHLSIYGNTFGCSCSAIEFLRWLGETNVQLDGGNYTCINMDGQLTSTKTINQKYLHRACSSPLWLLISTIGLSFTFVSILASFVFMKNKMKIQLFALRMIGRHVYPKRREDFIFDAYIIYSDATLPWVFNDVIRELELNRGLKLNLRDRDHLIGGFEADDIFESVRNSWKIVLILNEDFMNSNFAYFTMCTCLSSITMTTPERLIVIIDDQIIIPSNIDFLLENVSQDNILYLDKNKPFTDTIWDKFYDSIVHRVDQF